MTPLEKLIAQQIATTGPMTVADFMATALGHPKHGYYVTRDPLGRDGDFITAPEISQIFGELIGLWCVAVWQSLGAPERFNLVELGPGRGTLMADALRAASQIPAFVDASAITLVETSPVLREAQQGALARYEVAWRDSFDQVPEGPLLLIANEFFDALPVHQLVRTAAGWRERLVGMDEAGLCFTISGEATPATALLAPTVRGGADIGAIAEAQPAGLTIAASIANRIAQAGGAALVIDYGYETSAAGDTLQAVRGHEPQGVLQSPGSADLTVHVDFGAMCAAAAGKTAIFGPCDQGVFLQRLGIAMRADRLSQSATAKQTADIRSGVQRLIGEDEMGTLFKVLGLAPQGTQSLPGFEN